MLLFWKSHIIVIMSFAFVVTNIKEIFSRYSETFPAYFLEMIEEMLLHYCISSDVVTCLNLQVH